MQGVLDSPARPAAFAPFGGGVFGELLARSIAASPRTLMLMSLPAGFFWLAYFSWSGLWIAVAVGALGLLRQVAGIALPDRAMQITSLLALAGLGALAAGLGWVMMLPVLAAAWKTLAVWLRDRSISFRCALIGAEISYLVFGSLVGAQLLVMASLGLILINLSAIRALGASPSARRQGAA